MYVRFSHCDGWDGSPDSDWRPAWRVGFIDGSFRSQLISTAFPRKKDAEAAMNALIKAGITDEQLCDVPLDDGTPVDEIDELDRIMIGALQW